MDLAVAFILALCSIAAITASPGSNKCCFPDQYQGREHFFVENIDVYYWADFKDNLFYQTFDVNGDSYNVTDIAANKVYVVTKAGCSVESYEYMGLYNQCYESIDENVGIGQSEYSYVVQLHTIQTGGLVKRFVMQHRAGMCVLISAESELNGHKMASIFLYDFGLNVPTPPDMDTVKAMCS